MQYLPEIHDLQPGMADRLDQMLTAFPEPARPFIAWSVVPNWLGTAPLTAAPDFLARIKELPGLKILHGWTHEQGRNWINWLLYGHENRSEFAGLNTAATEDRIARGEAMFEAAGLDRPRWFCAPRWAPSASLDRVLAARGYHGILARDRIKLFDKAPLRLPPLNFDEGERAFKTVPGRMLREGVIAGLLRRKAPFRLVLHPDDLDHPATFTQFERTVRRLEGEGWRPVGLEQLTEALEP